MASDQMDTLLTANLGSVAGGNADVLYQPPWLFTALLGLLVLFLVAGCLWPSSALDSPFEILWSVGPRELDRSRIWRLILPTDALDFGEEEEGAQSPSSQPSSVVKRVSETMLSPLLSPSSVRADREHRWTFRPLTEFARDRTPLLVFINRGSGGRQGEAALGQLRALLSPQQVVDLSQGHAEVALQSFRSVGRFRVLVCGGDGTVAWVLSLLDTGGLEYTPPVAILPLGTGNDLARALGWGGRGPKSSHNFVSLLEDVDSAQVALLDRWHVSFTDARVPKSLSASSKRGSTASKLSITAPDRGGGGGSRPARSVIMQNYLGVGVDAKVALEWHQRRQSAPQQFTSVLRNKMQYMRFGTRYLFRRDFAEMFAGISIVADGVELELPKGTEGVIILNIASYGGGSDLWGAPGASEDALDVADLWNADGGASDAADLPRLPRKKGHHKRSSSSSQQQPGAGGSRSSSRQTSSREGTSPDTSADEWDSDAARSFSNGGSPSAAPAGASTPVRPQPVSLSSDGAGGAARRGNIPRSGSAANFQSTVEAVGGVAAGGGGGGGGGGSSKGHRRSSSWGFEKASYPPPRTSTPPAEAFLPPSMDDRLLEVVAVEGVVQLGLAQLSLQRCRRLCQASSITITSSNARLPLQIDGEPFELEPIFAPRKSMSITIGHHNQAVMLSRSRVRSDGVALEAIDWAMQEGKITVEQRNQIVREIARRTGSLQRRALSTGNFGGSNLSLPSLAMG